jgi:hypothetical protein
MERRVDYLAGEGLACRQGHARGVFARDLINTPRQRELDAAAAKLADETGLRTDSPATRRARRRDLSAKGARLRQVASPKIDDGLGFRPVEWKGACCVDLSSLPGTHALITPPPNWP